MHARASALLLVGCLILTILGLGCRSEDNAAFAPLRAAVARRQPPKAVARAVTASEWKEVRAFYTARAFRTAWTDEGKLRRSFYEAVTLLEQSGHDVLRPADYDVDWLRRQRDRFHGKLVPRSLERDEEIVAIEIRATAAMLRWGRHLSRGRFNPVRAGWMRAGTPPPVSQRLAAAIARGRLEEVASELRPPHGEYNSLLGLRERYAEIVEAGGWPKVTGARTVRPGQKDASVLSLRARLAATGELARRHVDRSPHLDATVAEALRDFQERHGLRPTGFLDRATRAALNVTAADRLRQIDVNLERWRFLPRDLGRRHIRVNIPDFYLALMENGRTRLGMRVVVGERETPTPILSDEMQNIVFSPYWNIPESIAADETLPVLLTDPDYLTRNNIEVVRVSKGGVVPIDPGSVDWSMPTDESLRFRQRPGADNALGLVKFVFPNHAAVYLHDTPADALFSRVSRALSHGCVRVERPVDLAHALLAGQGWGEDRIVEAMHRLEEQWVRLQERVPVHLMYWTAWVDSSGRGQFRTDIYDHDAEQLRAITAGGARASGK
jgi:murein L,D-transpeptidase YcbB/YkuD